MFALHLPDYLCRPCRAFWLAFLLTAVGTVIAEDLRCVSESDTYVGNAQDVFRMTSWMGRGKCIRSNGDDGLCYVTLVAVLGNLNELRKAEYSGAAGVLALLPTVGALLGAPTDEIWTLLAILPFGGVLAMALSFGGAIMPVRIDDYEHAMKRRNIAIGSIYNFRKPNDAPNEDEFLEKLDLMDKKISSRLTYPRSLKPGTGYLSFGLLAMFLLFVGSQAAMTVLEQGALLPWWCGSVWWMHLWYFMVTLTAVSENIVQLPFLKQHKLYVSRIAYEISLSGGESMLTNNLERTQSEHNNVGLNLEQLGTLPAAKVAFLGSTEYTEPRNSVLVMVSVSGSKTLSSLWRLFSKSTSIAVFITGTAMFASATLASLLMAVLALTLVLSAGVFGRAIAGWMVRRVAEEEPMIHVIVDSPEEANKAISRILKLSPMDNADVQVEIEGHIFVNGRRVGRRPRWHVAVLGVLAKPFDLRDVQHNSDPAHIGSTIFDGSSK